MACYQRHESRQDRLDLKELNKVLRAVGFAKFHTRVRVRETLPKPPSVPRKADTEVKPPKRGQSEPGSAKQTLQATIAQSRSVQTLTNEQEQQPYPPPPPTLHLHADTINRLARNCRQDVTERQQQQQQQPEAVARKRPPTRVGDEDSYHLNNTTELFVPLLSAQRCYRILSYTDTPQGRVVFDILSGTEYFCRSGPHKRRITPNVAVFASRQEALSERFPTHNGRMAMPRILVRFDAWGRCRKRYGGGGSSAVYEFVKFLGIVQFLDAPSTISKKQVEHPIFPHQYPMADRPLLLRKPVDRRIRVDKAFDVHPWKQ